MRSIIVAHLGEQPCAAHPRRRGGSRRFQGLWVLDREHKTEGDEQKAAELEVYSQQFCVLIGGDNCWNIDRIMRLPGTINAPDAKKRKKGRVEALASRVEWHEDRVYPLTDFIAAPRVEAQGSRAENGVNIPGNLSKVDLETLPAKLPSKTKEIIVHGEDRGDLSRFPSRSEALFYICCELVRAEVEDDVIASIILDRDLGISASVTDDPQIRSLRFRAT